MLRDGRETVRCHREERVAENELWKSTPTHIARTDTPTRVHGGDVRMPARVYMSARSSGEVPRTLSFRKEEENAYVFRNENVNMCFKHGSTCLKSGME